MSSTTGLSSLDPGLLLLALCALVTMLVGLRTGRWLPSVLIGLSAPFALAWLAGMILGAVVNWREFVFGGVIVFFGIAAGLFAMTAFLSGRALLAKTPMSMAATVRAVALLIAGHAMTQFLLIVMSGEL